jgi:hypothetical protein
MATAMPYHNNIEIQISQASAGKFSSLLGQGVGIDVPLGISLEELLSIHLGLGTDYVRDRIQTIFMNGKAIDREQEAMVNEGVTVALSAAMPGLVGATLRKAGPLSAMRAGISHNRIRKPGDLKRGRITLKLFNMIAEETGPLILTQGVWLTGRQMSDILSDLSSLHAMAKMSCRYNGISTDPAELGIRIDPEEDVFLKVHFTKSFCF